MPDTLKAQHIAHLTKGFVLYSDMGRVSVLDHGRYLRLARSALGGFNDAGWWPRSTERRAIRSIAMSGTATRATTSWWKLAKYGSGRARPGPERELLQQGDSATRTAAMQFVPGNSQGRRLRGTARRDERAGDPRYGPASARPESGYAPKPVKFSVQQGRAGRAGRSCRLRGRRTTRLHQYGKVFPVTQARYPNRRSTARPFSRAMTGSTKSRPGRLFRIVDLEGNQAVDTLFYSAQRYRGALQRDRHDRRRSAIST